MIKIFVFSVFVHILNTVWITPGQLDVIQKLLVDFLWRGCTRVKLCVFCSDLSNGGLKMVYVQNFMHNLWTKWMQHLCLNRGFTWSRFIWPPMMGAIPSLLLQGLQTV